MIVISKLFEFPDIIIHSVHSDKQTRFTFKADYEIIENPVETTPTEKIDYFTLFRDANNALDQGEKK